MIKKKEIAVVVPVLNEEEGIRRFLDGELALVIDEIEKSGCANEGKARSLVSGAVSGQRYRFTVIVVDDGSRDRTVVEVEKSELFEKKKVKLVVFARNFGKEMALTAGIKCATEAGAEAVILIDGDGQHPVAAIPEMLFRWENGAEVVTAVRKSEKGDGRGHKLGSKLYYKLYAKLGNGEIREGEMDFKVIDRVVMEEFVRFSEHNRIVRGLVDYLGFKKDYVEVAVRERIGGKPSYNFRKLSVLAVDSVIASSRVPLLWLGVLGVGITVFSLLLGMFILIQQYILHDPLGLDWSGAVAMCVFIAFLVGIVLVGQAVLGVYVSQIQIEAKGRPLYVIDRKRSKV